MTSKSVLIVDDEAYIRRVLEVKLKRYGYEVHMAKNGQAAMDLIHAEKPDVVITDINMPIMDGKTLCLKTNPLKDARRFLTIVVTARIDPEDKLWVSEMEDTILMEKPFSPSKILNAVKAYFGEPA